MKRILLLTYQLSPTVKLVKKHLDALRDGVRLLKAFDAIREPVEQSTVFELQEVLT